MNESVDPAYTLKQQRRLRQKRVLFGLAGSAILLVALCGLINAIFFTAGYVSGNFWPFARHNPAQPRLIASDNASLVQPLSVSYPVRTLQELFDGRSLAAWNAQSDGWDVQEGVLYGSNTRSDATTELLYTESSGWHNYTVEADITPMGSAELSASQLLFRYQDATHTGRCTLLVNQNGERLLKLTTPEGATTNTPFWFVTGETYRLRVEANGRTISCQVVNNPQARLTATTTTTWGSIGLQNRLVTTAFDNVTVELHD